MTAVLTLGLLGVTTVAITVTLRWYFGAAMSRHARRRDTLRWQRQVFRLVGLWLLVVSFDIVVLDRTQQGGDWSQAIGPGLLGILMFAFGGFDLASRFLPNEGDDA